MGYLPEPLHELAHAFHREVYASEYWRLSWSKTGDRWSNLEEKRTILEVENPVAQALGEPARPFHQNGQFFNARFYEVASPTTTVMAAYRRPMFAP